MLSFLFLFFEHKLSHSDAILEAVFPGEAGITGCFFYFSSPFLSRNLHALSKQVKTFHIIFVVDIIPLSLRTQGGSKNCTLFHCNSFVYTLCQIS